MKWMDKTPEQKFDTLFACIWLMLCLTIGNFLFTLSISLNSWILFTLSLSSIGVGIAGFKFYMGIKFKLPKISLPKVKPKEKKEIKKKINQPETYETETEQDKAEKVIEYELDE